MSNPEEETEIPDCFNATIALSTEEISEIRKAFSVFDVDGDGAISSKELAQVMRSFGLNPKEEDLQAMINKFDIDGDGMVSFPEFLSMMVADSGINSYDDIRHVIHLFDTHNTGFMDLTEVENILLQFGDGGTAPPNFEEKSLIEEMMADLKKHCIDDSTDLFFHNNHNLAQHIRNKHSSSSRTQSNHYLSINTAIELLQRKTNGKNQKNAENKEGHKDSDTEKIKEFSNKLQSSVSATSVMEQNYQVQIRPNSLRQNAYQNDRGSHSRQSSTRTDLQNFIFYN